METGLTPPSALQQPMQGTIGGLIPVANNAALDAEAERRRQAEQQNNQPVVQGLAGHVKKCWSAAYLAKLDVEQRMLKSVRQRRGEYDPEVLGDIQKSGGTAVYMMVTSNKCRAASAWLHDTLMGARNEKPWTIDPTPVPDLSPEETEEATQEAAQQAMAMEQAVQLQIITPQQMEEIVEWAKAKTKAKIREEAEESVRLMETKMEDQLVEGGFNDALSQFLDDLTTFPSAILKGPVLRRKPKMQWVQGANGEFTPDVKDEIVMEWERVDPFMAYPAPHATKVNDGFFIERHRMRRDLLESLIGVDGYSEGAIRAVLEQYGKGGLHEWLRVDSQKAQAEGKSLMAVQQNTDGLIDALQFWGSVQGRMLVEWGMDKSEVPDLDKEYNCEVWLIGSWVIKCTLNYDAFGRKPYYKTSYEEVPGAFWGNSVADLVRDCQVVCNAAARALVNNMGIASGPQVAVNVDRLPPGEKVTQMYPWKIWPTKSDPYGSTAPAVDFFQPSSLAGELMAIYEKFSVLADEYSGVPRYMTGDASAGGAGRTASGMSMLMGNAGKAIKKVIANIDMYIFTPAIEKLYYHNMKYGDDPDLKGDVKIRARGANALTVKEMAQTRVNEFLGIIGQNPIFTQIIGQEGIANLLRQVVKTLDMESSKIIPSEEDVKVNTIIQQFQQFMAQMQAIQQAGQPTEQINFQRDDSGAVTGANITSKSGQSLENGVPVTDLFSPQRGV